MSDAEVDRKDGVWDGYHDDPISVADARAVAANWHDTTQLSNALSAAAFEMERLERAKVESLESELSPRELRTVRMIADGASNAEVGVELRYSPDHVKDIVRSAREKLGASNRANMVAAAFRAGLIA